MPEAAERCLTGSSLPGRLADLAAPPERLFLRGELPRGPAVAIVGTRYPSARAKMYARTLAKELARAGVAVISGGAKGIDSAAHLGALAVGGATVVVAPAGFKRPFPEKNAALFAQVVEQGGAYLSLVEANVPGEPGRVLPAQCVPGRAFALGGGRGISDPEWSAERFGERAALRSTVVRGRRTAVASQRSRLSGRAPARGEGRDLDKRFVERAGRSKPARGVGGRRRVAVWGPPTTIPKFFRNIEPGRRALCGARGGATRGVIERRDLRRDGAPGRSRFRTDLDATPGRSLSYRPLRSIEN